MAHDGPPVETPAGGRSTIRKADDRGGGEFVQSPHRHYRKSNDTQVQKRGQTCPAHTLDNKASSKLGKNSAKVIERTFDSNAIFELSLLVKVDALTDNAQVRRLWRLR